MREYKKGEEQYEKEILEEKINGEKSEIDFCLYILILYFIKIIFFFMGSNSYFVAINILIIFIVMFINGLEH